MDFWSYLWRTAKLVIIVVFAIRLYLIATVLLDYALVYIADKAAHPKKQLNKYYAGNPRGKRVLVVQPLREEVQ